MAQTASRPWPITRPAVNTQPAKSASGDGTLELFKEIYGGRETAAGHAVNWRTALGVTTVLACARVIAEGVAQLPLKLYQDTGSANRPAVDHPLYRILHRRPNKWQTSFEFRETLLFHTALCGNGFAFVNRLASDRNRVYEIVPIQPGMMELRRPDSFVEAEYWFHPLGQPEFRIPRAKIMHLRGPSWDGVMGLEIVREAREAIGLAMATERHGARTFQNGGRVAGVLSSDVGEMNEEQVKQLRAAWDSVYGGEAGSGKTAILWGGLKWQAIAQQADQAQFLETRKHQVEDIARAFRVFPQMLGYADKTSTYASAEQFFLAHVVHTINPWVERLEQAIERDLLSEDEADAGYFAKLSVQGLLRGDARSRSVFYGAGIKDGWLTRNEVRRYEELDPLPGLDVPLLPLNMADGSKPPAPPEDPAADDPPEPEDV